MNPAERIKLEMAKVRKWKLHQYDGMWFVLHGAAKGDEDYTKVLEAAPVEALIAKMAKEIEVLRDALKSIGSNHTTCWECDGGEHKKDEAIEALADADKIWDEQNKGEVK